MSDYLDRLINRLVNFGLYSVEDDLEDIFLTVLKRYVQMERKSLSNGESEDLLLSYCRRRMEEMSDTYHNNLSTQTERVDFASRQTQWSYMYLYMLRHVHVCYYSLEKAVERNILVVKPTGEPLDVCMVGGGPGSDLLGICLLLKEYKCRTPWTNQVYVLDACTKWEYSWKKMYSLLPEEFREGVPEVKYRSFDFLDNNLSTSNQRRIRNAEMITMIKSLSPVAAWLKNREKIYKSPTEYEIIEGKLKKKVSEWHSVYSILEHMQPGAILMYLDNKTGPQREILMTAAKRLRFDVLLDMDLRGVRMPTSFLASSSEFIDKFEWRPCSTAGDNEMIILRKPGELAYNIKLQAI